MQHVWGFFSLPWSCLSSADLLVCGPHHSSAALGGSRSVKQNHKARAKEQLCVSASGAGSLSQSGVKVEAEMGEIKEKKERGWDELLYQEKTPHNVLGSYSGQKEGKCER